MEVQLQGWEAMKSIKRCIAAALACFSVVSTGAESPKRFVCSPLNAQTQIAHGGTIFRLDITDDCLTLTNLRDRSLTWAWKVTLKGSFGDLEATRKFCDRPDDGLVGSPAVWRQRSGKLIIMEEEKGNYRFDCFKD